MYRSVGLTFDIFDIYVTYDCMEKMEIFQRIDRGFQCALFEFPRAPREVHCWGVNDQGVWQDKVDAIRKFTAAVNVVDG